MTITRFSGHATTVSVLPGREASNHDGTLSIRDRAFTDIVTSTDPRIAGKNLPLLNIDLDPSTGSGTLSGRFELKPDAVKGTWKGELAGVIQNGLVEASGLAAGSGVLDGRLLRMDFQQLADLPFDPPCDDPKAFFQIDGMILE